MPTKDDLQHQLDSLLAGDKIDVILTEEQQHLVLENPSMLGMIWVDTKQATLLNHWPFILQGQIRKALAGDTAAAKWCADFCEPDVQLERALEPASWEQPAIELRDKLELEISAENLVTLILTNLLAKTPQQIRKVLNL